jgi:ribulose-5-phosphate 4-epimerase/fuculose-1-phosphate aldolase
MASAIPRHQPDDVAVARVELAAALRAAASCGFTEGIDNHFSVAVPQTSELFLINRYGPHWSEMRASDILTVDLDGNVVDGDGEWEMTAFMIHRGVHLARPSARCVFHTHMPCATAIAMTVAGLDTTASQNAMYFHGHVVRLPYGGHADGVEEGVRMGEALDDATTVVFLDNHGVLVVGASVADAWHKLYFLERACQTQILAHSAGQKLIRVESGVALHTAKQWELEAQRNACRLFQSVRRELDRANPGYEL